MHKLVYLVAVTLDGFIAEEQGGDPTGSAAFPVTPDLVEFLAATYPETLPAPARDAMGLSGPGQHFDTVIEGRASYDLGRSAGLDDAYPHLRHVVASRTLADGEVPVEVTAEPLDRVRELKAEAEADVWLVGGGTLAHTLLPEIDRLVLKVNPSVLGTGISLFAGPSVSERFEHADQVDLPSGVRVVTLERAR